MKRTDFVTELQAYLVPSREYPHVFSFVPPAAPRNISGSTIKYSFEHVHDALVCFRRSMKDMPSAMSSALTRREAIKSSQIEGVSAGISELYEYECNGDMQDNNSDVGLIYNHVTAFEHGLSVVRSGGGRGALTLDLVKGLHKKLMANTAYKDPPGEFRCRQNWIGAGRIEDAVFVPPTADRVDQCMADLQFSMLDYRARDDECFQISIVAQMAIAHAQFQTIHPFRDGNGRVGRMLIPLMLVGDGYPPLYLSGHLLKHQREYFRTLRGVQLRGEWGRWIDFFAESVVMSVGNSLELAKDLMRIRDRWRCELSGFVEDESIGLLHEVLLGHPIVTRDYIGSLLGDSIPIEDLLQRMIERQFIEERMTTHGRLFVATEILKVLSHS